MTKTKTNKTFQGQDWKISLKNSLFEKNIRQIRNICDWVNEEDLANWIENQTSENQLLFFRSLNNRVASEIFDLVNDETASNIINNFTEKENKKLFSYLHSDDIVELIDELPSTLVVRILKSISPEQRKEVNYILHYPDDSVGAEMNVNFIALKSNQTITEAADLIASQYNNKIPEEIKYYFVINKKGVLVGYLAVEDLLLALRKNKTQAIADIMRFDVISIKASDKQETAAQTSRKYKINELPVVDQEKKLVGILNTEQIMEILKEEYSEDIARGVGIIEKPGKTYFEKSSFTHFLGRFPWLFFTLAISTISQIIFSFFLNKISVNNSNAELKWVVFIVPFLPFIFATVGNVALQSTAIIVKNITLNEVAHGKYLKAFFKEIKITIFTLFAILLINILRKMLIDSINHSVYHESVNSSFSVALGTWRFWFEYLWTSFIILISVFLSLIFSAGLPILAHRHSLDPSLMSSPLLTTLIDFLITALALVSTYYIFKVVELA